jgi:nitroreductase
MKECLRLITERRSITFFDPTREVPDELIKEILEISATAPSGYNLQPWEVVVVKTYTHTDREGHERMPKVDNRKEVNYLL